jgi:adenosylhomocysteine nucleosidase
MGEVAVARALDVAESEAAKRGGLNGIVSAGWAGAISCGLSLGRAYWAAEIVDGESGARFQSAGMPHPSPRLTLATIARVAQPEEKRILGRNYAAVMVDMEAANLARVAQRKQLPFYCIKAISDSPGETLPDFSRFADAQGKLRFTSLVPYLLVRPAYWRTMLRMGKNSKSGAQSLAAGLRAFWSTKENANDRPNL